MHRYNVPEMTCGRCAGAIEKAVKNLDQRADVTIDLNTKEVAVRSVAGEARIAEAIRAAGYDNSRVG